MVILMKYKLVGIFTLIAFMCLFNFVYAKDKAFPLIGKVIYLDPGHGGYLYTRCNKTSEKAL